MKTQVCHSVKLKKLGENELDSGSKPGLTGGRKDKVVLSTNYTNITNLRVVYDGWSVTMAR